MALCLSVAFKSKATNDEIFSILKDVPNPNQVDDDGERMTSSAEPQAKLKHRHSSGDTSSVVTYWWSHSLPAILSTCIFHPSPKRP